MQPSSVSAEILASVLDDLRRFVVLLAADGTVLWANREALILGGCGLADVVGRPLATGPWWRSTASVAAVEAALVRANTGESAYLEVAVGERARHYSMTLRSLGAAASPVAIIVKGADVAVHRRDEERVREDAQYRAVVDTQTEVISRLTADGTILFVNDAYCRFFGRSRGALIGRRWHPVAHPDDVPVIERELARMSVEDPVVVIENRVIDGEGRVRWMEFVNRGFYAGDGRLAEIQSIGRDITLRKEGEVERERAERRMQERQRREGLGLLAGGVAHDINNVLACITAASALARREAGVTDERDALLDEIDAAVGRAARLCRQMLAYAGRSSLARTRLDLNGLIRAGLPLFRASLPCGASLRVELADGLPAIEGDETQLQQILLNLVGNAGEALRDVGGEVTITTRRVAAGDRPPDGEFDGEVPDGEAVVVAVRDDGVGMTAGVRARVFEPFFTTKGVGRGLGLAATAGLLRAHRAAIRVESAPGRGALFEVVFPVVAADAPAAPSPAAGDAPAVRRGGRGRVLVVDDDDAVRRLVARQLVGLGYTVVEAGGGREAVALFTARPAAFLAVLVDMTMPDINGDRVVREVRAVRAEVPVVVMSGYSVVDVRELFAGCRGAAFLQKPFTAEQLAAALGRVEAAERRSDG